jgi:hypothetical protein
LTGIALDAFTSNWPSFVKSEYLFIACDVRPPRSISIHEHETPLFLAGMATQPYNDCNDIREHRMCEPQTLRRRIAGNKSMLVR